MSSTSPKLATAASASEDWRPFPFRRVLPLSQLLLCAVIIWPYRAVIAFELFGLPRHRSASQIPESAPPLNFTLNAEGKLDLPSDPQFRKRINAEDNTFDTVALLNLPAVLMQLPHMVLTENHREWMPGSVPSFAFKTWRAITWPVLALPFWWMAGRGLEALTSARRKLLVPRLRWPETVISFLLMAGGATLAVGFLFFSDGPDRGDPLLRLFATALGMWGVLGSFTVVGRLAQWRIRKQAPAHS